MKFTLSWLRRHLETEATLDEIVETMIRVGLEVEEVIDPSERLKDFTIGHVLSAEKHPDADKLRVCVVATKDGEKQIVCGAPNARAGIKVAYAAVGTYVPGIDVTLSKAKIRGVESFGMMCSARELEMGDDHDGIIEAPQEAEIGAPIAEVMGVNDPVIDFEVTPNRPDTNGVMGVARDLAAAGLGKFITLEFTMPEGEFACPQKIELDFPKDKANACPVFGGIYIRGVKNGPSPQWMQQALIAIGLRPINMLVDVTNYISYDRARPLHVYDADKLNGTIYARLGRGPADTFTALDGKEYTPTEEMTVIADEERCLGLGGVMGGVYSGCTQDTQNVFIESAYFDPTRTAKTGRKAGIVSDARYRFERGIDPASVNAGLAQAVALITETCGGAISAAHYAGAVPDTSNIIDFSPAEVERLTGMVVKEDHMRDILEQLGFAVVAGKTWQITAPSFRPDIEGRADIVEEIARIVGLENIPSTALPRRAVVEAPKYSKEQDRTRLTRRALAGMGYKEAITWAFCGRADALLFGGGQPELQLANPISAELSVMRPSVLPGLIQAIGRNTNRGQADLALFEVGGTYHSDLPEGQKNVAGAIRASHPPRDWRGPGGAVDCFTMKRDALAALKAAGAPVSSVQVTSDAPDWYHPGRSGVLRMGPKNVLAHFGELHPAIYKAMDVEGPLYGVELFLQAVPQGKPKKTKSKPALDISDLQSLTRDFAFVVPEEMAAETLLKAVRGAEKKLITDVRLFDIYQGKGVADHHKSLALEVTIQPRHQTLTDEEIEAISSRIISQAAKTGAVLRG
ncbi:MAG: phenylalanine--tRNA ligase subunit beta [bacterium]